MIGRVLIVGSGPAGLSLSRRLLRMGWGVDMIEKFKYPGGLLRFGVASDHPEVRSILRGFDGIFEDPKLTFAGNSPLRTAKELVKLAERYAWVGIACGAERPRRLGVKGEENEGVLEAPDFYFWANGARKGESNFSRQNVKNLLVVGTGNVALDIARLILTPPSISDGGLGQTVVDFAARNPEVQVRVVARRGPADAACTSAALRELLARVADAAVAGDLPSDAFAAKTTHSRVQKKLVGMFGGLAVEGPKARLVFDFFKTPVEFCTQGGEETARVLVTKTADGRLINLPFDLCVKATGLENSSESLSAQLRALAPPPLKDKILEVGWARPRASGTIDDAFRSSEEVAAMIGAPPKIDQAEGFSVIEYLNKVRGGKVVTKEDYLNKLAEVNDPNCTFFDE